MVRDEIAEYLRDEFLPSLNAEETNAE
jgi:hypothetical protein